MPKVLDKIQAGESTLIRNGKKTAQRESFRAGHPADVLGSFVRTSRVKNFGQALETLENNADIHDPNAWGRCQKTSCRKTSG